MRTVLKLIHIVQQREDISVETVCVLSEEDLKFLEWCIARNEQDAEWMNSVEARYFEHHKPRVAPKLKALLAGLPVESATEAQ